MGKAIEINPDNNDDPILSLSFDEINAKHSAPIEEAYQKIKTSQRFEVYKLGRQVDVVFSSVDAAKYAVAPGYTVYQCDGNKKYPVSLTKAPVIPGNRMKIKKE